MEVREMDLQVWEVDVTGQELWPVAGFGVNDIVPSSASPSTVLATIL
jgi:hypothetical protein